MDERVTKYMDALKRRVDDVNTGKRNVQLPAFDADALRREMESIAADKNKISMEGLLKLEEKMSNMQKAFIREHDEIVRKLHDANDADQSEELKMQMKKLDEKLAESVTTVKDLLERKINGEIQQLLLLGLPYARSNPACENVRCAAGELCDPNTSTCRAFRFLGSNTFGDICNSIDCPDGSECDAITGLCIDTTSGTSSGEKCEGVACPIDEGCDWNTGRCVRFRKPFRRNTKTCADVLCPQNTMCDPSSGRCRQTARSLAHTPYTEPAPASQQSSCEAVVCPYGFHCNPKDGVCYRFKSASSSRCYQINCSTDEICDETTGGCKHSTEAHTTIEQASLSTTPAILETTSEERCTNVICSEQMRCDPNTGLCKIDSLATPLPGLCNFVECPNGFECEASSGTCRRTRQWKRLLPRPASCPPNSHYVECGTACPYTCSNSHRACSVRCVSTCQCDETFVQVSLTNLTCVPSAQCRALNRDSLFFFLFNANPS
ncbi:unnamed protein product [Toxocara canis]|uniref:TIL domain-containing protein n=1 Tax=Toxocara canis TaxID=6265 RepID=A0A183USN7_TOXCA|nr:unnamed protein product [Toxocara canis]